MSPSALRGWSFVHRWTSLLCTVFLLMLCLTGLPLIFEDELAALLSDDPPYADLPAGTPMANLDAVAATARRLHPDQLVRSFFIDDDEPRIVVRLSPSMDADPKLSRFVKFPEVRLERTGQNDWEGILPIQFLHFDTFGTAEARIKAPNGHISTATFSVNDIPLTGGLNVKSSALTLRLDHAQEELSGRVTQPMCPVSASVTFRAFAINVAYADVVLAATT